VTKRNGENVGNSKFKAAFVQNRKYDRVVRKDRKTERNQLQSKARKFFNPVAV
jgi:hypothetical protein